MNKPLHLGKNIFQTGSDPIQGEPVVMEGENFYRIANYDRMRPFFVSIVSSADHWMFISSTGALTAGRRNADSALFPYYTDDKIHDAAEITGSKTILIVQKQKRNYLWEPFSERYGGVYRVCRNLYKNFEGNKLIFEEVNKDLALTFRYGWFNSDRFGWVRKAWLKPRGLVTVKVRLLDGIQNIIPSGVGSQLQLEKSTLVDAYKRNERLPETGLGLFTLSSIPCDRPEPAEALKATTVWSEGLEDSLKLLSSVQLNRFREGLPLCQETDIRAERGAYFLQAELKLRRGQGREWHIVADVDNGPSEIAELNRLLRKPARLRRLLEEDVASGTAELERIVAAADGIQKTAFPLRNARHFNNVLFNVMRGGIFYRGYQVDTSDLYAFAHYANKEVANRHAAWFRKLEKGIHYSHMVALAAESGDGNLERLCREYLPLTFSRRHGDPSRPWNRFSIPARGTDGGRILNYEGNWRDIFQNWEALAVSFPVYTGMICKFLNASTADGYNPYRVSRGGIDWEVIEPSDPWSHIGYWGDHQVIYLLKFLEFLERHNSGTLRGFLTKEIFSYANVPYRIKPYEELLKSPKETVIFDQDVDQLTRQRVQMKGSDGKLVWDANGEVRLVNLTEKLLVTVLAKLSNFIPEAGIWLNTQRPEWNDANNALVGHGVSMVTLYYLRRFLAFCLEVFQPLAEKDVSLSEEVGTLLEAIFRTLECHRHLMTGNINDEDRRRTLDELGRAGSRYRERIYTNGFSGKQSAFKGARLVQFFGVALDWTEHSTRANRREDRLYHAYNLVRLDRKKEIPVRRLYEMLEGQVAVLSSGNLSPQESLGVLLALRKSAMYRPDQHSYLLYPDRRLKKFVEKNNIPPAEIARSRLLKKLTVDCNRLLVERDIAGNYHFNGSLTNARDVGCVLERLAAAGYAALVKRESALVLEIFENLFDHQSFTGRSGTFFGYEGLGSIYWHMVSKLLLAAQESFFRAVDAGAPNPLLKKLAGCYYDIRSGIGDYKSPEIYGAFPMDPYSHTPAHTGARQPGLTGQVKEDILCRMGELGVFVQRGQIGFQPKLLRREEFLMKPAVFRYYNLSGKESGLALKTNSLAFTYCQVPVIYRLASKDSLDVLFADESVVQGKNLCLDAATSRSIFNRSGMVARMEVSLDVSKFT
jgi:hypothetical protein